MANNQIDLLFGVSQGTTRHVIAGLKGVAKAANQNPEVTSIKYKMDAGSKSQILGEFQKLTKDINNTLQQLGSFNKSTFSNTFADAYKSASQLIQKTQAQVKETNNLTAAQEKLNAAYEKLQTKSSKKNVSDFQAAQREAEATAHDIERRYNQMKSSIAQLRSLETTSAKSNGVASTSQAAASIAQLKSDINELGKGLGYTEQEIANMMQLTAKQAQQVAQAYDRRVESAKKVADSAHQTEQKLQNEKQDVSALTQQYQKYLEALKAVQGDPTNRQRVQALEESAKAYKEMVADAKKALDLERQSGAEEKRKSQVLAQISAYTTKYEQNLSKHITLQQEFNDLAEKLNKGEISSSDAATRLAELKTMSRAAGVEVETLGQKLNKIFGSGMTQKLKTLLSGLVLSAGRRLLSDVKEIDAAMTELYKVTNETSTVYSKFLTESGKRAKTFGSTMSDVIKSTADFARLGYNLNDATKLADAAIVFKNVGDGLDGIDDASEKIISIVKAFPEFEGNAMAVVDKMNEVGNNYAISSQGIGEALQRSAGALTAANNTLDESIALAVGMNAVTQDPAKVGTSLKTLSMYLRAAKTEAEEAGEETDGMAESVSKLRGEILALTGNKVDIYDQNGDFKSTIQIMRELSAVWSELSDVSQANLLEKLGGKRNASVVASLLQNFDEVEKALRTAQSAEGSALKENETYLDSIQGRLDKLKATGQQVAGTLLQDRGLKNILSLLQGIATAASGVVQFLGGIPTALAGLGTGVLFKHLD